MHDLFNGSVSGDLDFKVTGLQKMPSMYCVRDLFAIAKFLFVYAAVPFFGVDNFPFQFQLTDISLHHEVTHRGS